MGSELSNFEEKTTDIFFFRLQSIDILDIGQVIFKGSDEKLA